MITFSWKMINGHVPSFKRWINIFWKLFKQLSRTNRFCQFIFSAKSGTRFNPCPAELFVSIFNSFGAGIANTISCFKWKWNERKIIISMKNRHLPNWIIWITEQIPKYMLQICLVFSFNTQKFAWKLINTVLAVVKYFYLECQVGPTCYISLIPIRIIAKVNLNFSKYCIALLLNVRQDLLLLFQFYEPMPGPSLPHIIDILIIG